MKKLIRKIIGYFGYDFIKVMPTPLKSEKTMRVGKFDLVFPSYNPLIRTYTSQKDYSEEIGRIVKATLKKYPDLVFLDVGANVGDTVAWVKSTADIPILSVEGDDVSYSYLIRNTKQFSNITTVRQFLGERQGEIKATLDKKGWNTTIIPSKDSNATISIKPLDQVLGETAVPAGRKKIFKVDTEGFDTIIIRGASAYLRDEKPVIYLEFNQDNMGAIQEDGLSTILGLAANGYDKILFYDDRGRYILTTSLREKTLIKDLAHYADGRNGLIYFYNLCVFHEEDTDLALEVAKAELER